MSEQILVDITTDDKDLDTEQEKGVNLNLYNFQDQDLDLETLEITLENDISSVNSVCVQEWTESQLLGEQSSIAGDFTPGNGIYPELLGEEAMDL